MLLFPSFEIEERGRERERARERKRERGEEVEDGKRDKAAGEKGRRTKANQALRSSHLIFFLPLHSRPFRSPPPCAPLFALRPPPRPRRRRRRRVLRLRRLWRQSPRERRGDARRRRRSPLPARGKKMMIGFPPPKIALSCPSLGAFWLRGSLLWRYCLALPPQSDEKRGGVQHGTGVTFRRGLKKRRQRALSVDSWPASTSALFALAEAPLLAISVSRLCPWLNAGLARVLVCELKREAIDARL